MDPNLLTLYAVAGGLSLSLSLVLTIFARFLPGTALTRQLAITFRVLAAAHVIASLAPWLPWWALALGTNIALLSGCVLAYATVAAWCTGNEATFDRLGWTTVLLTGPFFFWWGLIEPNGNYRSVVSSLAVALINGRTTAVLAHAARRGRNLPLWLLTALFAASIVWMLARASILLAAPPAPPDLRSANPTTWATIFGYIVLLSAISIMVMWVEVDRSHSGDEKRPGGVLITTSLLPDFGHKLFLLWSSVVVVIVTIIGTLSLAYISLYATEHTRMTRAAQLANDAFVVHAKQVVGQAQTILNAAHREFAGTRLTSEVASFAQTLAVDRTSIGLISADGHDQVPHGAGDVSASQYFQFHRDHAVTSTLVSMDDGGDDSGWTRLHLSRRVNAPDGSFGGVVVVTVNPASFDTYASESSLDVKSLSAILETKNHRYLARIPNTADTPENSLFWETFKRSPSGLYEGLDFFGNVRGVFAYRLLDGMPLLIVNGFAQADLMNGIHTRMRWMVQVSILALVSSILLALLFTLEAKHSDEQDRLMSMLTHELKTPMSVILMAFGLGTIPADIRRRVSNSVADMNSIVDRCLQANRLQQGHVRSEMRPCHVNALVERAHANCTQPELISIRNGNVPPCRTDEYLLSVILSNLIENAIKYGAADKTINVTVERAKHKDKGSKGILITVTNAPGTVGMPNPNRVFRKYYRAPGAHNKAGSGLGLHIAACFARQIKGELRYSPSADRVRFELWIPA